MTTAVLWVLVAAAIVGLVFVQWLAIVSAKRLGARSKGLVALRVALTVAVLALMAWVVWTQIGR